MRISVGDLMTRLRDEKVASEGDVAAVRDALSASQQDELPIYLRVLVGLGAWVATILLIAFFLALGLVDEASTAAVFGIVLVGGSVWLRRRANGDFTRHAAVAVSFAGQGLIVFAIDKMSSADEMPFVAAVVISLVMITLFPDALHRFISALVSVGAAAAALFAIHMSHALDVAALATVVVLAFVWRGSLPRRSDALTEMLAPVGYGLAVGLFGVCLFGTVFSGPLGTHDGMVAMGAVTTDGVGVMLAALVLVILHEHDVSPSSFAGAMILLIIALFAVVTLQSPGIIIGAGMLLLGFDRRNLVLIELATAFLLVFGAANYYNLNLTLLEKSAILVASGALCLVARLLVGRLLRGRAEALPG